MIPLRRHRRDVAALLTLTAALVLLPWAGAAASAIPNDPGFPLQWSHENSGQAVPAQFVPTEEIGAATNGTPYADDSASEAWAVTTGIPQIVIGEVDTGIDYEHPDLAANVWTNPGGIGKCEAGSGCLPTGKCANGTHGYDVLSNTCNPMDEDTSYGGHGTHVAGIMGAVGNNGIGVAGLAWHTPILPVEWLDTAGPQGDMKNLAAALRWLVEAKRAGVNVRVVNDSPVYKASPNLPALREAIEELNANGILFVTAAGNGAVDENTEPVYPCAYDLPNEICVTATNNKDELPPWANRGSRTVDIAAPGTSIYSTMAGVGKEANYRYLTGTSMAAAQVSAAAALILSVAPTLSVAQLKADILANADKLPSLEGKLISGGRLDVCHALPGCTDYVPPPPPPPPPPPAPQPVISALKISPHAFKAAARGPAISSRLARAGATVTYTDSLPALTRFTLLTARTGVVSAAGKCVAQTAAGLVHARRRSCTRYVFVGAFTRVDRAGPNRFRFSGHFGHRALPPGRYHLRAQPIFGASAGAATLAAFRIIH